MMSIILNIILINLIALICFRVIRCRKQLLEWIKNLDIETIEAFWCVVTALSMIPGFFLFFYVVVDK